MITDHEEMFWSLFAVDMDAVLGAQTGAMDVPQEPTPAEILGPYASILEPAATPGEAGGRGEDGMSQCAQSTSPSDPDRLSQSPSAADSHSLHSAAVQSQAQALASANAGAAREHETDCWHAFPLFLLLNDYLRQHSIRFIT